MKVVTCKTRSSYNNIYKLSSKLAVFTIRLLFKDQPVNVIRDMIADSFENQMGGINTICGKNVDFPLSKMVVALFFKALVNNNMYT